MDRRRWNVFFFNFLLLILFFLHIILIYLSTYLLVMLHGMAYGILVPQTRDQTHTPCIGNTVLTTGPPGKSQKKMDSWNIHMVKLKKKKNTSCLYLCLFKYSEKGRNHGWKERLAQTRSWLQLSRCNLYIQCFSLSFPWIFSPFSQCKSIFLF